MASDDRKSVQLPFLRQGADSVERRRLKSIAKALDGARRRAGDGSEIGGTPYTILKLQGSPLARLADRGRVGGEELRAADDIALAFFAISGGLMIRPRMMERRDRSYDGYEPGYLIDAQARYRAFADHWSRRAKLGDPMLEIVIAVVVDERPFSTIEHDVGIRHGKAADAAVAGLRDYAARAGWVDARLGHQWIHGAAQIFPLRSAR